MKKYIFVLIFFASAIIKTDNMRVSEPWDLQRRTIPGAVLEVQETPYTTTMSRQLALGKADTQLILNKINELERQKNELDEKIQNPLYYLTVKKLKAQSAALDKEIQGMHKEIVAAEKQLQGYHHDVEKLQNPHFSLGD